MSVRRTYMTKRRRQEAARKREAAEALTKSMRDGLASVTGYAMQAQDVYREWKAIHDSACTYECKCGTWRQVHEEAKQKLYKAQDAFIERFAKIP